VEGRVAVALADGAAGRVELRDASTLAVSTTLGPRRTPTALLAVGRLLVVGTDEGIETWTTAGGLVSRKAVGPVRGLSAAGDRVAVAGAEQLQTVDLSVPSRPVVLASVAVAGSAGAAALASGVDCAVGASVVCGTATSGGYPDQASA